MVTANYIKEKKDRTTKENKQTPPTREEDNRYTRAIPKKPPTSYPLPLIGRVPPILGVDPWLPPFCKMPMLH